MIAELKQELETDPLGRGYGGMTPSEIVASINAVDRPVNVPQLSGDDLFTATASAEFAAVPFTDAKRQMWVAWCSAPRDPFNATNVAFVQWLFGAGSATVSNLAAIRVRLISRKVELGLSDEVYEHTVIQARSE